MWFALWTVLLIGSAVLLGVLGFRVFKSAIALWIEGGDAMATVFGAADRRLRAAARDAAERPAVAPTIGADPVELRLTLTEVRARGAELRAGRQARARELWDQWARFNT